MLSRQQLYSTMKKTISFEKKSLENLSKRLEENGRQIINEHEKLVKQSLLINQFYDMRSIITSLDKQEDLEFKQKSTEDLNKIEPHIQLREKRLNYQKKQHRKKVAEFMTEQKELGQLKNKIENLELEQLKNKIENLEFLPFTDMGENY